MTANKTAKGIVSNISSFCVGYFGKPIPADAIPALEASTEREVKEYRASFERRGDTVYIEGKPGEAIFVYRASSVKQAQEIVDALSTYV